MTMAAPPRPFTHTNGFESIKSRVPKLVVESHLSADECFGVQYSTFVLGDDTKFHAITDRGTAIPLYHYEALITPAKSGPPPFDPDRDLPKFLALAEKVFVENFRTPSCRLVRVAPLNPASNCHGWIFADGQFCVNDSSVSVVLDEHEYEVVPEPRHGDIALYRANGAIIHSGCVRLTPPNHDILIESKWGPFGVFLHSPHAHPGTCTFYRNKRGRHALTIESIAK